MAGSGRGGRKQARRPGAQQPDLSRLVVADALRTWVVPTVALTIGFVVFVLLNVELITQPTAVTTAGMLALGVVFFYAVRGFFAARPPMAIAGMLAAGVLLWSAAIMYPFYRSINPGTPIFTAELARGGAPVSVPLRGKPGRYQLVVEGHFLPAQGRENRSAAYHIAVGHAGQTERVITGTFHEEWGRQRVGSGRRSSLVPVLHQTNRVLAVLDDPEGRDVTLQLTDVGVGVRDSVSVRVYLQTVPPWATVVLDLLTLGIAVLLDAQRPTDANAGVTTALTMAALVAVLTMRAAAGASPGFPQLIISALAGVLGGAIGGLLWRMVRPLRKYVRVTA
jgi:hypothetical protein